MAHWTKMSDFFIELPDRPGELARLAAKFRAADIALIGLWGYGGDGEFAHFYCVPENPEQFRAFAQSAELKAREGTTFYFTGADHVGSLVRTLEEIASTGISLHAIQSVATDGEFGCFVWADPKDWDTLARMIG
jgi:hypothetical protein